MANKKFTDLPISAAATLPSIIAAVQSGESVQLTLSQTLDLYGSNIIISESQVLNLVQDLASKLNLAGGTMTGSLILNTDPSIDLQAATKRYVDDIVGAVGTSPCAATTTVLLDALYDNGASGVGATLVNNGALVALVLDSSSLSVNDRVLIKDQTNKIENGIYTVTVVGDGATAWVLTRSEDYDEPTEITPGDSTIVYGGATFAITIFIQSEIVSSIGSDDIDYVPIPNPANQYSFSNTTESTSPTTGAFTTAGGLGVEKNINSSGNISISRSGDSDAFFNVSINGGANSYTLGIDASTTNNDFVISRSSDIGVDQVSLIDGSNGDISVLSTTDASDVTSGSLHTDGGLGVTKTIYVGTGIFLPTTGGTAAILDHYEEFSHTTNWSGIWNAAQAGNSTLIRVGNLVNMNIPEVISNSNAAAQIVMDTVLPARFRPASDVYINLVIELGNETNLTTPGFALIQTTGDITVGVLSSTGPNFDGAGGNEGFYISSLTWKL